MFGHDDNQQPVQDNVAQADMPEPIDGNLGAPAITPSSSTILPDSPTLGAPVTSPYASTPDPVQDLTTPEIAAPSAPLTVTPSTDEPTTDKPVSDDLMQLKQQALQHLSPLVNHLDQTPEEKFRTTMMMIQASDDQTLVKAAFEAAQAITDDKARAQALLDVINEINYFTQQQT